MSQSPASPFGNIQTQYASVGSDVVGAAGSGGYGISPYSMNSGDFVYSLMPFMFSRFVPALRARGLPFKHMLDVTDTVAAVGATAKVTIAQNQTARNLIDGQTKILNDVPPLVSEVTISDDIYNSFGVTDFVSALISKQPTIPATVQGALFGILNSLEEQLVTDLTYNVPAANVVGAYNTALTSATLSSAQSVLVQNYAPAEEYYGLVAPSPNAYDSLIAIPTITWTQTRWAPATGTQNSLVVDDPVTYGQEIQYLGGRWSQSNLVAFPTVTVVECNNIIWNKQALAVIVRPPDLPMPGIGVVARNFVDAPSGIALQMSFMYNKDVLAQEAVIRTMVGDSPGQQLWSCLIKS